MKTWWSDCSTGVAAALFALGGCKGGTYQEGAASQSIIGKDDSRWVTRSGGKQPAFVTAAIDAIGILGGDCTAFYIGNSRAVTAGHCFDGSTDSIEKGTPCRSWSIKFGYLREDTGGSQISTCNHIESHKYGNSKPNALNNDYAVIVIDNPPRAQVRVNQGYMPASTDAIAIVGYQGGSPLKYSLCTVSKLGTNPYLTAHLFHTCDTKPGESGAPVFLQSTGEVIGIHTLGVGDKNANGFVPLKLVPLLTSAPKN